MAYNHNNIIVIIIIIIIIIKTVFNFPDMFRRYIRHHQCNIF